MGIELSCETRTLSNCLISGDVKHNSTVELDHKETLPALEQYCFSDFIAYAVRGVWGLYVTHSDTVCHHDEFPSVWLAVLRLGAP